MSFIPFYRKTRNIIRRGTRAGQPLATNVLAGTLYFVTNESVLERSNGTVWETYGAGGGSWVVQSFTINVNATGGVTTGTATITAVDLTKAFLSGVTQRSNSISDDSARDFTCVLTNTTTVTATFNTVGNVGTRIVTGFVVESP